jgi:hypothetical protein
MRTDFWGEYLDLRQENGENYMRFIISSPSLNIIRVIKSRGMRLVGQVAGVEEMRRNTFLLPYSMVQNIV